MTRVTTFPACFVLFLFLLLTTTTDAEEAIVVGASGDRLRGGSGGGASVLWIHFGAKGTVSAGATFFSLAGTRWSYGTVGGMHRLNARTMVTAEANIGDGNDDTGSFRYVVVRGGVTRELLAKRLYGEAEWLQTDVARRQNGIARLGATFLPSPQLTLRGSVFQSIGGDDDTSLVTVRGDYDLGGITAIAGFSAGRATPVLLQQSGSAATRVREAFAGAIVNNLTIIVTAGDDRQRVVLSWRLPLRGEGR